MDRYLSQRHLRRWLVAGAASAVAVSAVPTLPASSAATSTLTLTTAPHILSVTVGPAQVTFGVCSGGDTPSPGVMGFPNATCRAPGPNQALTVTDQGQSERILVQGGDFVPVDSSSNLLTSGRWALCGSSDRVAPACSNQGLPGPDQYRLRTIGPTGTPGGWLSNSPQCDTALSSGGCLLRPGQQVNETFVMLGPSSASNPSNHYETTVTWTAVP